MPMKDPMVYPHSVELRCIDTFPGRPARRTELIPKRDSRLELKSSGRKRIYGSDLQIPEDSIPVNAIALPAPTKPRSAN